MNYQLAQSYCRYAKVQRDVAREFEKLAAKSEFETPRILALMRARNCRAQMRTAALRMVDHLRPLPATRELRALGRRLQTSGAAGTP